MIFLRLLFSYLVIGLFGFGGGYAMLALIQNEIVTPGWVTEKTFTDIVAISQMTPGPIGINSATYIGYVAPQANGFDGWYWGVLGSLLCTLVVIIPSFVLVAKTSHLIDRHRDSVIVKGMFSGLRPVVVGLIASAAMLLMNSANFGSETYDVCCSIALCVASFCIVYFTKIHPIAVIFMAAVAGYIIF
jgi:chromate transporter